MSYYQGDFYQGDFYQGDPGIFSGLMGMASRFFPASGAVRTLGARVLKSRVGQMVLKHPTISAAATAGTIGALGGGEMTMMRRHAGAMRMAPGGAPMRGFHVSRKTGRMVRNRRMRVTNPRALRRAIRRANGFARLARRVMHFTSPRPPRGRAIFRAKRKPKL